MNKLLKLLHLLFDEASLQQLAVECHAQNNLTCKLILLMLQKRSCSNTEAISKLKISENTYNKTCSLAKEYLLKEAEKNISTPFDSIYVIQKLIFSGETGLAQKLLTEKEKELEKKQLWLQLEVLYVEASRICYVNGNIQESLKLQAKRTKNAQRLEQYVKLYSELVNEMIRLEGFKNRNPNLKKYLLVLSGLKKEAYRLNHHVLIHNAEHLHYTFAGRFLHDTEAVYDTIQKMLANAKQFDFAMNPLAKAVILNAQVNFLTIYRGFGSPDKYITNLKKSIHHTGKLGEANMCYAMLEYYLYLQNIPEVMRWLNNLEQLEDNSKYRQYKHIVYAIKAFIEKDKELFRKHFLAFYNDPSHLDFPDMEINLRIIELIALLDERKYELLDSRIVSLKKYISRNSSKERYSDERKLLVLINQLAKSSVTAKTRSALSALQNSPYRNIYFLTSSLSRLIAK